MSIIDRVIAAAKAELGSPYVYGAEGPSSFDCSGLTQYAFAAGGIKLPRTAAAQQSATTRVTKPSPGDLVFYGSPAHHVAIYLGGGKMIAAPHTGDVVKIQDVYGSPTYGRVSGAGLATADPLSGDASSSFSTAGLAGLSESVTSMLIEGVFVIGAAVIIIVGINRSVRRSK